MTTPPTIGANQAGGRRRSFVPTRICLAILAGLAYAGAFAWPRLWPLTFAAPVFLLTASADAPWRARAGVGALFALVAYGLTLRWADRFGLVALIGITTYLALWWATVMVIAGAVVSRERPVLSALGFAALWCLAEYLRGVFPFGGFPWARIGLPLAVGPLRWIVPWAGALGLTAFVVTVGGFVWALRYRRIAALLGLLALAVLVVAAETSVPGGPSGRRLRVAAVQGNVPLPVALASAARAAEVLENHARLTGTIGRGRVDLVLWPETLVHARRVAVGAIAPAPLASLARSRHAWLVAGVDTDARHHDFRNLAISLDPHGRVAGVAAKTHGVPFGEYVPWRSVLGGRFGLGAIPRDIEPGTRIRPVPIGGGRAAVAISYEVAFPDVLRTGVRHGGGLLLVPTNVSSYGPGSPIAEQELLEARARALESRRWLVQASPSGISAVVGPDGGVRERSGMFTAAVVRGGVQLSSTLTPYDRTGDLPVLLVSVFCFAIALSRQIVAWSGKARTSGTR